MLKLGLTGSIGMGKSTVAQMFREAGVPVHDSDATVHSLYSGAAVPLIEKLFPGTTVDGMVDRNRLALRVLGDAAALGRLEKVIHPLVGTSRDRFVAQQSSLGASLVVLDIPLLFETGAEAVVDAILVVTASADIQKARVLSRSGMTQEKFARIAEKQLPDTQKQRQANYIIHTDGSLAATRSQVLALLTRLAGNQTATPHA